MIDLILKTVRYCTRRRNQGEKSIAKKTSLIVPYIWNTQYN